MAAPTKAATTPAKPVHSLVLDTGPLIKNDPPVSALRERAEHLYVTPSVVPEIRDAATRARVQTTLMPFVTVRQPSSRGLAAIREFARKTGDLGVLSRQDIEVLALAHDLECERNGGDWRLRSSPDQKQVNGKPPQREAQDPTAEAEKPTPPSEEGEEGEKGKKGKEKKDVEASLEPLNPTADASVQEALEKLNVDDSTDPETAEPASENAEPGVEPAQNNAHEVVVEDEDEEDGVASDDDGGWITPSNVKKHQARDDKTSTPAATPQRTLQAAVLTSDYAMQNVALRMNLNLVTPSLARITRLRTWLLRCHGCFAVTRDMERQFCPRCGQPTLLRVSCSTDASSGQPRVHLRRDFHWNKRGNVYSVPKPVHGSANGRLPKHVGGGRNNWGAGLLLAEDQKEYVRAADAQRKQKKKDLMDDDFLPAILTGDRSSGGKIRVGAGRSINSRRRR